MVRFSCIVLFIGICARCYAVPIPVVAPGSHYTEVRQHRTLLLFTGYDVFALWQMERSLADPFCKDWRPPTPYLRRVSSFDQIPDAMAAARRFEQEGDASAARDAYRELIKVSPQNMEARHALVVSCLDTDKEFAVGIRELVSSLVTDPQYWQGWLVTGQVTSRMLMEITNAEEVQLARPLSMLQFVVGVLQERPSLFTERQREYLARLKDLILSSPNSPDLRSTLVTLTFSLFDKAAQTAPDDPEVFKTVAATDQLLWGNLNQAQTLAEACCTAALRAAELLPNDGPALTLAGYGYSLRARSIEVVADRPETQTARAELYTSAIGYFRRALLLDPSRIRCAQEMAKAFAESGKVDEGLQFMQTLAESMTSRDDQAYLLTRKAVILTDSGQKEKAEEVLTGINRDYPDFLEPYYVLLEIYAARNDTQKQLDLLTGIVRSIPEFLNARVSLGYLYEQTGDIPKAEEQYIAAVRLCRDKNYRLLEQGESVEQSLMRAMHSGLLRLAGIYENRGEFLKAADLIAGQKTLYYKTDRQGNLLVDAKGNFIPHTPVELPAQAAVQTAIAYSSGRLTQKAIDSLSEALRIKSGRYYVAQRMLLDLYLSRINRKATDATIGQQTEKVATLPKALAIAKQIENDRPGDPEAKYQIARLCLLIMQRSVEEQREITNKHFENTSIAEALSILDTLVTGETRNIAALLLRARVFELIGDGEKACKDARAALELEAPVVMQPAEEEKDYIRPATAEEQKLYQAIAHAELARALPLDKTQDSAAAEDHARQAFRMASEALRTAPKGGISMGYKVLSDDATTQAADTLGWLLYHKAAAQSDAGARSALLAEADPVASSLLLDVNSQILYHVAAIRAAREMTPDQRRQIRKFLKDALTDNPAFPEAPQALELLRSLGSD